MRIDRFQYRRQFNAMNEEERDDILMDDVLEALSPEQAPVDDLEDEAENPILADSKEKPREEQLDYPESLPYQTESLAEMDDKSVSLDSSISFACLLHFLDSKSFCDDSSTASTPRITMLDSSVRRALLSTHSRQN